ncbi:hypothetical protein [Desulfobacula phenolica]|uniref:Uncharacterized protein n=1 Tax=Desulfobacula phenolica TaxID=90732 RepID=A0A1H2DXK1_9BACT|nr:hypothetical protein [Desulfobacula phenolica]SDT87581.1 hypothetical protein SAMN04487931_102302 [Desulfobacula phenolica]
MESKIVAKEIVKEKIVREIELENNQTLVISDWSRKVSEDAYVVIMKANMDIKIKKDLFSDEPLSEFKFEDILATLGGNAMYEYRVERNFIMDHEKDDVFDALVKTFLDNLGKYVANSKFPGKFILKAYKDKNK